MSISKIITELKARESFKEYGEIFNAFNLNKTLRKMSETDFKEACQLYERELLLGEKYLIEYICNADPSDELMDAYYEVLGSFLQERISLQKIWPYSNWKTTEIIIKYFWCRILTKNFNLV